MLNNQPMGFYHPATLVKDAQRHGVGFAPIDVQESDWECRVEPDGRVRLGLMYVNGLREEVGKAVAATHGQAPDAREEIARASTAHASPDRCPKCGCDDESMLERTTPDSCFCNICAYEWPSVPGPSVPASSVPCPESQGPESRAPSPEPRRYPSIEALIAHTGLRRDELATLAEIGALNAFGHDRRSALWQIERAIRPSGELFDESRDRGPGTQDRGAQDQGLRDQGPLCPMSPVERVVADYAGTSLTIGPHPMALRRAELALRGVLRARDLPHGRHGRRVRVAGAVITRQRPGTAKGFVFLTLEDETGIANIIVQPGLFADQKATITGEPYLLVEGTLQIQEGVTSVKADRVLALIGQGPEPESHDFR
jgi:error-prone DNA polymerase